MEADFACQGKFFIKKSGRAIPFGEECGGTVKKFV
jgi:hypothetical protein